MGFKSGYDYERFANGVTRQFRYRLDAESQTFLDNVMASAKARVSRLAKGTVIYRAQLGAGETASTDEPDGSIVISFNPFASSRMLPLPDSAKEGRANPKGIPVVYAALGADTAMCEVRPNLASEISLAELEIVRDVALVDCTKGTGRSIFSYGGMAVPMAEREEVVWRSINDAFTKPVDAGDSVADYAPTQILAECFKQAGFDGIRYRSGFGTKGDNIALFSLKDVKVILVQLMALESVEHVFRAGP